VLAKNYPNVYLDFSWLPLISPEVSRHRLSEWLEMVPCNKFTWGGDAFHVEEAYGHVAYFRQVVADVLGEKVEGGYFDQRTALNIARRILYENAREIYKLDVPGASQVTSLV